MVCVITRRFGIDCKGLPSPSAELPHMFRSKILVLKGEQPVWWLWPFDPPVHAV